MTTVNSCYKWKITVILENIGGFYVEFIIESIQKDLQCFPEVCKTTNYKLFRDKNRDKYKID